MLTIEQANEIKSLGASATPEQLAQLAEFNNSNNSVGSPNTGSAIGYKQPVTSNVSGEITGISPLIQRNNSSFHMVSLTSGGVTSTYPVSSGFMTSNSMLMQLGKKVNFKLETRIAGVTGYKVRATGVIALHTSSGNSVVGVTLLSDTESKHSWVDYSVNILTNNKPEFQTGIGTVLAGIYAR